ncbi:fasciclin domain-containing protein [Spongiimicrobium sp. 3-5]|uniref:fasciclin domain-containing protein n=1 Tax=Spongiimicrobium sp. 3-5 TaxID=3332596 RepID=UPI0039816BF1
MNLKTPLVILLSYFTVVLTYAQEDKSIIRSTEDSKNHKTLLAAVKGADLERILDEDGPFTVFAPSDTAFEKLSPERVASLLDPENKKELHSLVTYHIVAGNLTASNILKAMCRGKGKASFTTVQGNKIWATMRGIDIILSDDLGNTAKIITADSSQCNGVIHEIDSVILPKKI